MKKAKRKFSIWTYIGSLLLVYGVLLLAGGFYQIWHPPPTVLSRYHATFWAGLVLTALGIVYMGIHRARQRKN